MALDKERILAILGDGDPEKLQALVGLYDTVPGLQETWNRALTEDPQFCRAASVAVDRLEERAAAQSQVFFIRARKRQGPFGIFPCGEVSGTASQRRIDELQREGYRVKVLG